MPANNGSLGASQTIVNSGVQLQSPAPSLQPQSDAEATAWLESNEVAYNSPTDVNLDQQPVVIPPTHSSMY